MPKLRRISNLSRLIILNKARFLNEWFDMISLFQSLNFVFLALDPVYVLKTSFKL